jgi:hypothetical protein
VHQFTTEKDRLLADLAVSCMEAGLSVLSGDFMTPTQKEKVGLILMNPKGKKGESFPPSVAGTAELINEVTQLFAAAYEIREHGMTSRACQSIAAGNAALYRFWNTSPPEDVQRLFHRINGLLFLLR